MFSVFDEVMLLKFISDDGRSERWEGQMTLKLKELFFVATMRDR